MEASILLATEILDQNVLEVTWNNDDNHSYPYIWLRDNCPCRKICWDASGTYINYNAKVDMDVEVKPVSIEVNSNNNSHHENSVFIEWSDGHYSEYSSDWLLKYRVEEVLDEDQIFNPEIQYWNSTDIQNKVRKYEFNDLLTKDEVLLSWITDLRKLGVAFVVNAPAKPNQLVPLGDRVNFLQKCHYGLTVKIQVRYGPSHGEATYNSDFLPLHTDFSFYQQPPGIVMLHCISAAEEGGDSLLSDGFKVAEDLRRDHPEEFKLLTTTTFENFQIKDDEKLGKNHFRSRHPIIRLTAGGKIDQIVTGQHKRTAKLQIAPSKVLPVYRALKLFHDKLHDETNMYRYKLNEGDIVCINNYRVLHGRDAFKITKTCHRYLEGSYLDWDQVNSRTRVLWEKLGRE